MSWQGGGVLKLSPLYHLVNSLFATFNLKDYVFEGIVALK